MPLYSRSSVVEAWRRGEAFALSPALGVGHGAWFQSLHSLQGPNFCIVGVGRSQGRWFNTLTFENPENTIPLN